jgi:hypothetical protein
MCTMGESVTIEGTSVPSIAAVRVKDARVDLERLFRWRAQPLFLWPLSSPSSTFSRCFIRSFGVQQSNFQFGRVSYPSREQYVCTPLSVRFALKCTQLAQHW